MERKTHTIDAADKILGRLATQIAILLRGKHKRDFVPYQDLGDVVVVKNIDRVALSGKKMSNKVYYRHSGRLGHLKKIGLEKLFKKDAAQVLKRAVFGMLPKNKLRSRQIKRLKIEKLAQPG